MVQSRSEHPLMKRILVIKDKAKRFKKYFTNFWHIKQQKNDKKIDNKFDGHLLGILVPTVHQSHEAICGQEPKGMHRTDVI